MQQDSGTPAAPIWLIGDSDPSAWRDVLATPLDPRHPTRHSIWTPVWDYLQERLYVRCNARLRSSALYVRNAVRDAADKPLPSELIWARNPSRDGALTNLRQAIDCENPLLILSFGHFAFEFCRRAVGEQPQQKVAHWKIERLGHDFRERLALPESKGPLLVPLLHASIARGLYLLAHSRFCDVSPADTANYFEYAGAHLADWIIERGDAFKARDAFSPTRIETP